ncbi:hypothetical protein Taro_031095 [Colocasia esculenta]|uniref:Uncharacterized protein n=1 Tax=Colocasia esculenta TaxID=4460 RepID=A0A843VN28_COLES|nr:hypothetical protein [Colocasia esculenta]
MATSPPDSAFNEVERFDEYNPHPYQGGYDIALTYGQPLSPSSAVCYPISPSPASIPASEPSLSLPAGSRTESETREAPEGGEPAHGGDSVGEEWGRGYVVGGFHWSEDGFRPGEAGAYLGYSPFPALEESRVRGGSGVRDILNCAADYLFGYLRTYGEKRDECSNYGNLNYAYERHNPQEPLLIQFSLGEPSWCGKRSSLEDHNEGAYPNAEYGFSYGKDSLQVTHSEIVCVGSSWSPTSYHEDCTRHIYPQSECSYAYERCYYGQPLSVQHEEVEHTWSQKPSFLEFYEKCYHDQPLSVQHEEVEHTWSQKQSSLGFYERCYHDQPPSVQHEQVEHTWPQKSSFFDFYENQVSNQSEDMHAYGTKIYEQPLDMLDFIEKSWYQILNDNEPREVIPSPQPKSVSD